MNENFREFLERLRQEHELTDIKQAVDIRHIATLVDQSDQVLYLHPRLQIRRQATSGRLTYDQET